jgi:hypothetical protein
MKSNPSQIAVMNLEEYIKGEYIKGDRFILGVARESQ